jgi:anti-sigma factor RsiW
MRCGEVQQRLDLYATKELPHAVRERIDAHLEACDQCREALAKLRRFEDLLSATPAPPVPDGFAARVVAQAKERQARVPAGPRSPRGRSGVVWQRIRVSVGTAIALATGLLIGVFMGHETWRPGGRQPPAASTRPADPSAASGFEYLIEPGGNSLAQAYLGLTATLDR